MVRSIRVMRNAPPRERRHTAVLRDCFGASNSPLPHRWPTPRLSISSICDRWHGEYCARSGAVFMSEDGLHGLRPDRSRCAAGLVAAHETGGRRNRTFAQELTCRAESDPAGVRLSRALLEARALLSLMASYEATRRRSDCSVMAGIVASDTSDNGALQAALGRGRRYQN
jgi:hypothetical protein